MATSVTSIGHRKAPRNSGLTRLTLEGEVFSLRALAPEVLDQLPLLFAQSVVESATRILGETTGEALVRFIGDSKLRDPGQVYSCLDSFLFGGSDEMKKAIVMTFSDRVHRLYKVTVEVAALQSGAR